MASSNALASLQSRDFRLYTLARFTLAVGIQVQSVAVGWHVYSLTHRALDLGLVGLAQFLPAVGLSLFTGTVADRFDRRRVLICCYGLMALACSALIFLSLQPRLSVAAIYGVLVGLGTARAFAGPASQALVPHLVGKEDLANAITWNTTAFQLATIAGPSAGGLLFGINGKPTVVYGGALLMLLLGLTFLSVMRIHTGRMEKRAVSLESVLQGVRYVWREKLILGCISLDLFAVLLGGAVALLPIFAHDVLRTGAWGFGVLRSAPAVGAAAVALWLAFSPIKRKAGMLMLVCVFAFGLSTIVFGLSHQLWVSLLALVAVGATDMVSMVIRSTLIQVATPPELRGRVSAVNMVFIGASNELGEFESGLTAAWLGAVRAVVYGGIGTCAVVLTWAAAFPRLRRADRLDGSGANPTAATESAAAGTPTAS